ncbi:Silenced mating-type M-specific polypeptide Mc [Smittium culicis]|uniref:Silenced mating-type M-specific polypeptide Mc n=1 Tax=Smittium culicis TaxID=133412 RepID=A0A1R1XC98_9FUNG|nr:Silenced mating-type M-specific polypeptide Mc [Smittium culicis]
MNPENLNPIIPSGVLSNSNTEDMVIVASGYTPIMIPNKFLMGDYYVSFSQFSEGKIGENYTFCLNEQNNLNLDDKARNSILLNNKRSILDLEHSKTKISASDFSDFGLNKAHNSSQKSDYTKAQISKNELKKEPKKPPNAFILYRRDWHKKLLKKDPKTQAKHISSQIAEQWKKESYKVKLQYLNLALQKKKFFFKGQDLSSVKKTSKDVASKPSTNCEENISLNESSILCEPANTENSLEIISVSNLCTNSQDKGLEVKKSSASVNFPDPN